MKKEDLDVDPQSMDNRRLGAIARNPNHPMHTHAKAELDRRKMAKEEKDPEEYDNEGKMMKSQLRQICSANEKLMSMVKDDDNLPEWVQSKVTKATDYIRSVRDYLESEKMEEKTLTPAELKKREKIAKAIERDNPDMPMDKKMAIATATAKRVAEATDDDYHKTLGPTKNSDEGIAALKKKHGMSHTKAVATLKRLMGEQKVDEISSNKLGDYMRKSAADVSKSRGDVRRQDKRIGGQKMADDKIRKKMGYSSQAKVPAGTNEDTDLAELKKSTLASYIKKASDDRAKNAYDIGKSGKINYKGLKRRQGINRAVNKMANEENIDEVLDTPKAMRSYKDKAKYSKDRAANSAAAKILRGPDADGNRADHSPELKTMAKRDKGLKMADKAAMRKTFKALRTAKNTHGK